MHFYMNDTGKMALLAFPPLCRQQHLFKKQLQVKLGSWTVTEATQDAYVIRYSSKLSNEISLPPIFTLSLDISMADGAVG